MGKEEIIIKTPVDTMINMCKSYIDELDGTEILAAELINYVASINFYFYELYLCVIEILTYIDRLPDSMAQWQSILLFLKHKMVTKRRNRISQMETDSWLKSHVEVGALQTIAKYRFPFKAIIEEPLKNILGILNDKLPN